MQAPIDHWKIEEIRKYLEKRFPAGRFDDYTRGPQAHLFAVRVAAVGRSAIRQDRHNLVVTRQFFDRFPDTMSLRDGLDSADVAKTLEKAGERTVELY
jgi:hypothetical protein